MLCRQMVHLDTFGADKNDIFPLYPTSIAIAMAMPQRLKKFMTSRLGIIAKLGESVVGSIGTSDMYILYIYMYVGMYVCMYVWIYVWIDCSIFLLV